MLTCIWALEFSPQMFFRGKLSVFPPIFKYHNVFQNHSEDYIGNDDIIDINEVIVLCFFSLQSVILYSKNSITENIVKIAFPRPSRFSCLRMLRLTSANTKELYKIWRSYEIVFYALFLRGHYFVQYQFI